MLCGREISKVNLYIFLMERGAVGRGTPVYNHLLLFLVYLGDGYRENPFLIKENYE